MAVHVQNSPEAQHPTGLFPSDGKHSGSTPTNRSKGRAYRQGSRFRKDETPRLLRASDSSADAARGRLSLRNSTATLEMYLAGQS